MDRHRLRQLYLQCRTYTTFDRALVRSFAITAFCAGLLAYDWHFILEPLHRAMALPLLAAIIGFAVFYELTIRDVSSGVVLAAILTVGGATGALWLSLILFHKVLPNDHAPLRPAGGQVADLCAAPADRMRILLGSDRLVTNAKGLVTPFRIATCPAPSLRRTAQGLTVSGFGYDEDGNALWRLRDNQFARLDGEYLHVHRPDRSSLGIYDRWEREIFFVRYLAPDTVRIRGLFFCGAAPPVAVGDSAIEIGARRFSQPRCLNDSAGGLNYVPLASER
jgi:hypothetical protein